jgi:hypothetical protein
MKEQYTLADLKAFAAYDGNDSVTSFVAGVARGALKIITELEAKSLEAVANSVSERLPEDAYVYLEIENGAALVTAVLHSDFRTLPDTTDKSLYEQVEDAVTMIISPESFAYRCRNCGRDLEFKDVKSGLHTIKGEAGENLGRCGPVECYPKKGDKNAGS